MYVIEFRYKNLSTGKWLPWDKSGNDATRKPFKSYSAALAAATSEQKSMGINYEYRVNVGIDPDSSKLDRIKAVLNSPTKLDQINAILEEK